MFGRHKPEIIRTCLRCGGWGYIPKRDAHRRPEKGLNAWASRTIRSSNGTLTEYHLEQERLRALVTCRNCGSESFTDKPAPPVKD